MMFNIEKILLVCATELELNAICSNFERVKIELTNSIIGSRFRYKSLQIDTLVCGIGIFNTTFNLTEALNSNSYDLVINSGIAGTYTSRFALGDVVFVNNEQFAEFGIISNNTITSLFDTNLVGGSQFPFTSGKLVSNCNLNATNLPIASALTVGLVSGDQQRAEMLSTTFNVEIESMEGAAVFFVCSMKRINFVEIRSISNYVGVTDKEQWDINLALNNLKNRVVEIINTIC